MKLGGKHDNLLWLTKNSFQVPPFVGLNEVDCLSRNSILSKTSHLKFPVAVRSSFLGEDGGQFSFAGLFETQLHIQNQDELLKAVEHVASSLKSSRVHEYCQHHNIPLPGWGSVVVQEMVQSKKAGVIFSTSPLRPQTTHISAASGYGEQLVSGEVDADEYFINKSHHQYQAFGVLSENEQKSLFEKAALIEKLKTTPQDIEWSIDQQGQLYFLQTRPITAEIKKQQNDTYFDNSNIQESFVGITLPLTFSYARNAYRESYNMLMRVVGFSETEVQQQDWRHRHMLGLIDGRVYYNINSWYEGLMFLPHFGRNKKDMENMMGLEKSIDFIESVELSFWQKIIRLPKMIKLLVILSYHFFKIKKSVHFFDEEFNKMLFQHRKMNLKTMTAIELHNYLRKLQSDGFALWGIPLVNDFYVMMKSGKVRRILSEIGKDIYYPRLIKSNELESFKPISELQSLISEIRKDQNLLNELSQSPMTFINSCQKNHPKLHQLIIQYIDAYGDRVLGELKLETQTYRTHPHLFVETLKLFSNSERQDFQAHVSNEDDLEEVCKDLSLLQKMKLKSNLKQLQNGLQFRELMRFHRTRSFGMIREIYREIGQKLSDADILKSNSDIFYLTMEEIDDLLTFQNVQNDLKSLIQQRTDEYANYSNSPKYKNQIKMKLNLQGPEKFENYDTENLKGQNQFQGTGCFPGIFKGEICYIKNLSEAHNLHGKILMAERTDPGWTPLFYLAKAVIVEKGSLLSHAAIVAREVGIPTIIGVPHVTRHLKNGDTVTVNGSDGTIFMTSSND